MLRRDRGRRKRRCNSCSKKQIRGRRSGWERSQAAVKDIKSRGAASPSLVWQTVDSYWHPHSYSHYFFVARGEQFKTFLGCFAQSKLSLDSDIGKIEWGMSQRAAVTCSVLFIIAVFESGTLLKHTAPPDKRTYEWKNSAGKLDIRLSTHSPIMFQKQGSNLQIGSFCKVRSLAFCATPLLKAVL